MRIFMQRFLLKTLMVLFLFVPLTVTANAADVQTVGTKQLQSFMQDYLDEQKPRFPHAELRFNELKLPEPFAVPAGKLTCEITPSDPLVLPSRRFNLILRVDGEVVANMAISATVEALAEVAVAAKDLRQGTTIDDQDILLALRDLNTLRSPCLDHRELVGKRLKRSLRADDAFERVSVVFPPLIKRGELVTIMARKGALTVTARGLAQQQGHEGELIRVRNIGSNKDILCKITGPESVIVEF